MRLLLCKDTDYILKIERGGAKVRRIIYGNRVLKELLGFRWKSLCSEWLLCHIVKMTVRKAENRLFRLQESRVG